MNVPDFPSRLLQKLKAKAYRLPDHTPFWQLTEPQAKAMEEELDQRLTRHPNYPFPEMDGTAWQDGPVLIQGLFGPGILFQSLEDAQSNVSRLREQGFSAEEWFVSFNYSPKEVSTFLSLEKPVIRKSPSSQDFFHLKEGRGFLLQMKDGRGMWFGKKEDVSRFQESIMEVEDLV